MKRQQTWHTIGEKDHRRMRKYLVYKKAKGYCARGH